MAISGLEIYLPKREIFSVTSIMTDVHHISVFWIFTCGDTSKLMYAVAVDNEEALRHHTVDACQTISLKNVSISHLSHTCYMPHPSYTLRGDHPHNLW
jgi:hypothetical protein